MLNNMPVLFIGHGSPMNAIASNEYTEMLAGLGKKIPSPRAILCISAHWMTEGSWVTHMEQPKTIHDFYGFPQPLFDVQYPAPGAPDIAEEIERTLTHPRIHLDSEMWGLDHGTWSVLRHMYPKADIPVMQLSLYLSRPADYHFTLGRELTKLRSMDILIIGSGNIVHNLRAINWETYSRPHTWAVEFDEWMKDKLEKRDFRSIVENYLDSEAGKLAVPSPDHYFPLLYALGASTEEDKMQFEFEAIHNASISMRCLSFGL